jgi:chemotaxis protein MotD
MSRLDQAQALSPPDDDATPRAARSQTHVEQRAKLLKPGEPTTGSEADVLSEPRFASSISAAETRTVATAKVVVREQETHFEPVPQLTLLQKIVDRIAPDLPTAAPPPGPYSAEVALHQTTDTPIRMLTLQLDPPNMGTVTVRMRLAGDAVEVRLSADRHETTQLLREERGALTDAMQSAGYSFEIASIDHSRTSDANPAAGQSHAQSEQQQSQQPQGGSQIDNGTSERQSNDTQAGTRHNRQGHDQLAKPVERNQDEQIVLDRNGGALYL